MAKKVPESLLRHLFEYHSALFGNLAAHQSAHDGGHHEAAGPAGAVAQAVVTQPSSEILRPIRVPMTEAIMRPRVQPELSPRQWSPWRLVLKSVSIFTRLE